MPTKKADCFGKKIIVLPRTTAGKPDKLAHRRGITLRTDRAFVCPVSDDHLIMSSFEEIRCIACNHYWRRKDVE